MKPIFVRPAKASESDRFLKWSILNDTNEFDPEVPKFPTTFTLCAYNKDKIVAYLPVQQPLFLESLAVNPEATETEIAQALGEFVKAAITQASIKGNGEIYFLGTNDSTTKFAERIFEEVPFKLFRLKIKELEPNENNN